MLGIHMASMGPRFPLRENWDANCMNRIYEKLRASPIPIFMPIPPLTFRDDSETPISVRMKAEKTLAIRE